MSINTNEVIMTSDNPRYRGKIKYSNFSDPELNWMYGDLVIEQSTGKYFLVDLNKFTDDTKLCEILVEVVPETVGQYIGVPDRNNKPVFKGDIVEMIHIYRPCKMQFSRDLQDPKESTYHAVVDWSDGRYIIHDLCGIHFDINVSDLIGYSSDLDRAVLGCKDSRRDSCNYGFYNSTSDSVVKVVGNIHDNLEAFR